MGKRLIGSVGLAPGSDEGTDLTTKGDIHGFSTSNTRIPIGSNDQILTADSSEALGLKWATASGGGATAFVESFTQGSDASTFVCTLTSAVDLTAYDVYINFNMNSVTTTGTIDLSWNSGTNTSSSYFNAFNTYVLGTGVTTVYNGNTATATISGAVNVGVGAQFVGEISYLEAGDTVRSPMFVNAWNSNNKQTIGIFWYDGGASETSFTDITFTHSAGNIEAGAEVYVWSRKKS
jgi:hypothetical protein